MHLVFFTRVKPFRLFNRITRNRKSVYNALVYPFLQELTRKRNRDSESDDAACLEEVDDLESEIQNEDSEEDDEIETKRSRYEVSLWF